MIVACGPLDELSPLPLQREAPPFCAIERQFNCSVLTGDFIYSCGKYAIILKNANGKRGKAHVSAQSDYRPTGDQPQAIEALTRGLEQGMKHQVLLGVTGSGKTFTRANIIKNANRPALVIAHNKTLAAQLAAEFREFFPENAVGYFVSYYDYYQPEAYIPSTDTLSKRIPASTTRSTGCATARRRGCPSGATW